MPPWADRVGVVFGRELKTVARTRGYALLTGGFALLVLAIALTGGTSGYVPLVLSLLTPVELLVPLLAGAFGYAAVAGGDRDEIDLHRTFPVTRGEYVGGVYLARLSALLVAAAVPLTAVAVAVPLFGAADTFLPQSTGLDSPVLYLRFVSLTAAFGATVLAVFHLVSAVSTAGRRAAVAALLAFLTLVFGFDAAAVVGLDLGGGAAAAAFALLSPNGAYRELVLSLVVAPVTGDPVALADVVASAFVLVAWLVVSLSVTGLVVWTPVDG